jgi:hypothetical protein
MADKDKAKSEAPEQAPDTPKEALTYDEFKERQGEVPATPPVTPPSAEDDDDKKSDKSKK